METSNSGAYQAVVHVQNDKCCLGPIGTCDSGLKVAVLHAIITGEVWDPQRLVIIVLKSSFCKQKTTGEGWNA